MPAVVRRVRRRPRVPDLTEVVDEYCLNRSMRERSAYHEARLKSGLMSVLERVGESDGEHRKLLLDAPIEFTTYKGEKGIKKTVLGVQRQKRQGAMTLNEERTLAWLAGLPNGKRRRLMEQCLTTVQVINEDALLAANFEGQITDDELKALYDESDPTYAFYLITED
jgi:hypothetical protein